MGKVQFEIRFHVPNYSFLVNQFWYFLNIVLYSYFWEKKYLKKKKLEFSFIRYKFPSYLFLFLFFFVTYSNYAIGLLIVYSFSILVMSLVSNFNTLIFLSLGRLDWKCVVDELGWPAWADHFTKSRVIWAYFL